MGGQDNRRVGRTVGMVGQEDRRWENEGVGGWTVGWEGGRAERRKDGRRGGQKDGRTGDRKIGKGGWENRRMGSRKDRGRTRHVFV